MRLMRNVNPSRNRRRGTPEEVREATLEVLEKGGFMVKEPAQHEAASPTRFCLAVMANPDRHLTRS